MEFINQINCSTLIICSYKNKEKILKELNKSNKLVPINFMTLEELYNSFYFAWNEESIFNIIKKYNIKYDIAKTYLDSLIYIEDKEYKSTKINKLLEIKNYLRKNGLLKKDETFNDYLKTRKVIFYGFDFIDNFTRRLIKEIENVTKVEVINKKSKNYEHKVLEFFSIEEEVEFVASKICEYINKGIDINNIKLANVNEEYEKIIKRVFKIYNIPVNLSDKTSLYSTIVGKEFIRNYNNDLNNTIKILEEKYDETIINQFINIVNKYAFNDNKIEVKELIIEDLNNTYIQKEKLENAVEIIDYSEIITDNEYVFLLGFNLNSVPKIIKDEKYLNNADLKELELEDTIELSIKIREATITNIKSIKNLIITYKLKSNDNTYLPSNLVEDLCMEKANGLIEYNYSNLGNKIKLCKDLDNYFKYNIESKELNRLYSNYNIPYKKYNNSFSGISKSMFQKIINNELNLSYSSLQTYNECSFKYYIKNVLKLDLYEDTFSSFIGTLFHHILEIGINKNIDVQNEVMEFIKDKKFSNKERFFINKLIKDIALALDIVREGLENSKFKDIETENKIEIIKKNNITFKGFIDKIMIFENNMKKYAVLVDYKTYDTDLKLDLINYGLNIQLPIYLYLANSKFRNLEFVGFYVQKILSKENKYNENKTLEEQKKEDMKLSGYSINDTNLLEMFDKTYENSKFINGMKVKTNGEFYSSSNVLSKEEIQKIISKTDEIINKVIDKILKCDFNINPKNYKESNISCKYCKYKDLCFVKSEDIVDIIVEEGDIDAHMD